MITTDRECAVCKLPIETISRNVFLPVGDKNRTMLTVFEGKTLCGKKACILVAQAWRYTDQVSDVDLMRINQHLKVLLGGNSPVSFFGNVIQMVDSAQKA